MRGDVMWQVDAASPGSGGASPYLRRSFALNRGRGFPPILVIIVLGLAVKRLSGKNLQG
jgi:hypothetical protein